MYESNVMGQMRMTRALLPKLVASGDGHVVGITSIAAIEPYVGGAGYNAAKHAQRAMLRVLRQELLGQPVRVTEVVPGMVETEFSLVRFGGDEAAAAKVYEGMQPLSAEDVAECIRWALAQPAPRQHRRDRRPPARPGDRDQRPPALAGSGRSRLGEVSLGLLDHGVDQLADALDLDPDRVADVQQVLAERLAAEADAGRGAGGDHVAGLEGEGFGEVGDLLEAVEDHLGACWRPGAARR